MKNSTNLQNSECNEIPLTEEKRNLRAFRMISTSGFLNILQEDINEAEIAGKHLTHEQAFEIINQEYKNFTGEARYKNFQSFKRTLRSFEN
jgi:hypothetical protein